MHIWQSSQRVHSHRCVRKSNHTTGNPITGPSGLIRYSNLLRNTIYISEHPYPCDHFDLRDTTQSHVGCAKGTSQELTVAVCGIEVLIRN